MKDIQGDFMKFLALLVGLVFSVRSFAAVQIQIHGLRQNTGSVIISLFASAASWDKETPDQTAQISPLHGADAVTVIDLPPGQYGFFLYHDVDGDGKLKRGAFGLPGEPYAFSNNVHIGFSKPSFDKMKFTVDANGAVQDIQLVNP
jgi:uncharacterized protein (DUF2141 family)